MEDAYIKTFAEHMHGTSAINVEIAQNSQNLKLSRVYVASKKVHIEKKFNNLIFKIFDNPINSYNPDINELFISCSKLGDDVEILACILTGIGEDGAKGISTLCGVNATCLAESEDSAVVYGMPLRAKEASSQVKVKTLDEIIETIKRFGV